MNSNHCDRKSIACACTTLWRPARVWYTSNLHHMVSRENLPTHDREAFNSFVYFPLEDAVRELLERERDKQLEEYVEKSLPDGLPDDMKGHKTFALFRHLATSNYEIHRFAMVADAFPEFKPLILEFAEDKFNDRNEWKYFLGKLRFHKGVDKHGQPIVEHLGIINFNESNNKPISSLRIQQIILLQSFN